MKENILRLFHEGKTNTEIKSIIGCSMGAISYHIKGLTRLNPIKNQYYCLYCKKISKNKKYCSRSCCNRSNYLIKTKDTPRKYCEGGCGKLVANRIPYCSKCINKKTIWSRRSKDAIRVSARRIGKSLGWKCCSNCGYDKHFDVAHIQPLSSFPSNTPASIVNDVNNIKPLCPNCHWEFDHNKLACPGPVADYCI